MFSKFKLFVPYILILIFITLIYNFYITNKKDFEFIYNFNLSLSIKIIVLCFFYLLSESIILKYLVKFFFKKIDTKKSFFLICSTYLCNTFVQFSGLGFRAYYLTKIHNIKVTNFIILSLYIIIVEVFVFSVFGLLILSYIEYINPNYQMTPYLRFILLLICISSFLIYLFSDDQLKELNLTVKKKT